MDHYADYKATASDEVSLVQNNVKPYQHPINVTVSTGTWDGINAFLGCLLFWGGVIGGIVLIVLHLVQP